MDKTAFVKNELRNTEIYFKEIYGYRLKKQKLELDQANLRSPSLSNSGGQHYGASNFDLLDYTDEIQSLDTLINLYLQKIQWNKMIVDNAPVRLRTIILAVYVNHDTYDTLAKNTHLEKKYLINQILGYFENTISDAQIRINLELSKSIKKAQKKYYEVIRMRKNSSNDKD